jgi:hypothetical protein
MRNEARKIDKKLAAKKFTHALSAQNQSPEFFWKGFEDLLLLELDMIACWRLLAFETRLFSYERIFWR